MAYTSQDRVYIRNALGFSSTFQQFDPRLEMAISASQSVADGGSLPDSNTENLVKALIYGQAAVAGPPAIPARLGLLQVKANLDNLFASQGATKVDGGEVELNVAREDRRIRNHGRTLVTEICRILGVKGPRADIFSPSDVYEGDNPFVAQQSMIGL